MKRTFMIAALALLCLCSGNQYAVGQAAASKTPNVKEPSVASPDLWASPRELRAKKLIATGIYSLLEDFTPRFLAEHPDFTSTHPYDGLTVDITLDQKWCVEQGVETARVMVMSDLTWTNKAIPYAAVQSSVADLKRVSWGSLTDNFLWYRFVHEGADVDFSRDTDWAAVQQNAALAARICRESKMKGFMLDTEQYGKYISGEVYPMGKDTPELLRQRGRQWIKAVQAEYPAITIMVFYAWSPHVDTVGFLKGVKPFLDGVLDAIEEPARLIYGYDNTVYYGQIAGTRFTEEGVPGSRAKYQWARDTIKGWRSSSEAPEKYDKFVKVGMAAWVESDPWDLWVGYPSGTIETVWSNAPLALAYSDEYIWVWSEHTNYAYSHELGTGPNPFLASLSNQTFNTGHEAVASITEDFKTNPLLRGWYFDFDMLDVGRKKDPSLAVPIFSADAVPYVWSKDDRAVRIQGVSMTGPNGDKVAKFDQQRRRYVHPIQPLNRQESFQAALDFSVDSFGSDPSNPIVLGLFNSDQLISHQSLTLQIYGPDSVRVVLVGDSGSWFTRSLWLVVKGGLKTGKKYRIVFDYAGRNSRPGREVFKAKLFDVDSSSVVAKAQESLPSGTGSFQLDEIGAAIWDVSETETSTENAYRYRLERATLNKRSQAAVGSIQLLSPMEYQVVQRDTKHCGQVLVSGNADVSFDRLEVRISGKSLNGTLAGKWRDLPCNRATKAFGVYLPIVAGGWYRLELRAVMAGKVTASTAVEKFGVGEVFVTAGQSNSTNCGESPTRQTSGMVSSFSGSDWRLADDPQIGAHDGSGSGSPWPSFGDSMFRKYHVPIGVAVTGHGGSSVMGWNPGGELFRWMVDRMHKLGIRGFRGVLWHQGESDAGRVSDEDYYHQMAELIYSSNKEAGWVFPWFVAKVGVQNAQQKLWKTNVAMEGPDTDKLSGDYRYNGGAHFTLKGLKTHGSMWAEQVGKYLDLVLRG